MVRHQQINKFQIIHENSNQPQQPIKRSFTPPPGLGENDDKNDKQTNTKVLEYSIFPQTEQSHNNSEKIYKEWVKCGKDCASKQLTQEESPYGTNLNVNARPFYPKSQFNEIYFRICNSSPTFTSSLPSHEEPYQFQYNLKEENKERFWLLLRARFSQSLADYYRVLDIKDEYYRCGYCDLHMTHRDILREHVRAHFYDHAFDQDGTYYTMSEMPVEYFEATKANGEFMYKKQEMNAELPPPNLRTHYSTYLYDKGKPSPSSYVSGLRIKIDHIPVRPDGEFHNPIFAGYQDFTDSIPIEVSSGIKYFNCEEPS